MAYPVWFLNAGKFILGVDLKKIISGIKPLLPYGAVFLAGWVLQGHRLNEKRIEGLVLAKDNIIARKDIQIETERSLVKIRDDSIEGLKSTLGRSDKRVQGLEEQVTELAARVPKDTTTIIDKTKDQVDEIISQDDSYKWLRYSFPDSMLDDANRTIRDAREYRNPSAAKTEHRADRRGVKN